MSPSLLTLISYAVPLTLLAGLTMWVGYERKVRWHVADYIVLYIPFLLVFIHVSIMYHGIDEAVVAMGMSSVAIVLIAGLGGMLGGLCLLPRLFVSVEKLKPAVLSSATSTVVGLFCLKMFFLAAVIANPAALVAK